MRFFRDFFGLKLNGLRTIFCLTETIRAMLLEPPAARDICQRKNLSFRCIQRNGISTDRLRFASPFAANPEKRCLTRCWLRCNRAHSPLETGACETNLHDVEQEKANVDEARLIQWRWSCVG